MGWNKTHEIRLDAKKAEIAAKLEEINALMLYMPPRFTITVEDGRVASLNDSAKEG